MALERRRSRPSRVPRVCRILRGRADERAVADGLSSAPGYPAVPDGLLQLHGPKMVTSQIVAVLMAAVHPGSKDCPDHQSESSISIHTASCAWQETSLATFKWKWPKRAPSDSFAWYEGRQHGQFPLTPACHWHCVVLPPPQESAMDQTDPQPIAETTANPARRARWLIFWV
jgi:hypothetical protein